MQCPLPRYYLCHALIALTIGVVLWPFLGLVAGLAAGAAFYAGREYTQWEGGIRFDWRGLLSPLLTCLTIIIMIKVYTA
jgi:hypothetical protein